MRGYARKKNVRRYPSPRGRDSVTYTEMRFVLCACSSALSTTREYECVRICSYQPISISTRRIAQRTHDRVVFDETECKFGNFIAEGDRLSCVFSALLFELFLQLRKIL